MKVLIADDDPITRDRLETTLRERGYEVAVAHDGRCAWDQLQADPHISVLVTDWLMPELDGPDLCRRVRETPRDRYLPIILLTSRDAPAHLVEGLDAGADAFVTKPFDPAQLLAQIRVAERVLELEARLAVQLHETQAAHERLEMDLKSAAEVQRSLLPEASPRIHGVDFGWVYDACDLVGGDMFNVFRLDENRVGMYVLDVSGHGTPAALQSVSLGHTITPFDQHGGILKRKHPEIKRYDVVSPVEVARKLNRRFQLMESSGQFFTFLYGMLDVTTREVRYVRAGHPGPIVVSGGRARCYEKGGGIPIGILPEADYEEGLLQLSRGDCLVFYTDGVLDTLNASGEAFGLDRLVRLLGEPPHDIGGCLDRLRRRLLEFGHGRPRRDDVTIVGLQIAS